MDQQLQLNWGQLLAGIAHQLNPIHSEIFVHFPVSYYWTTYQGEWAMDLVFRPAEPLRRLYPKLLQLGMTSFSSADVMRFLGKKTTLQGNVPGTLTAAVCSDLKQRPEGVRIKHSLGINSVKLYDKAYYFLKGGDLVLGPFWGKPACVRIPLAQGVSGSAAARGVSLLVPGVHAFPRHIACDAASRSELVVPAKLTGPGASLLLWIAPRRRTNKKSTAKQDTVVRE